MAEVKTDLAEVKSDLSEMKFMLQRLCQVSYPDETRTECKRTETKPFSPEDTRRRKKKQKMVDVDLVPASQDPGNDKIMRPSTTWNVQSGYSRKFFINILNPKEKVEDPEAVAITYFIMRKLGSRPHLCVHKFSILDPLQMQVIAAAAGPYARIKGKVI
ncbi:uncharacterized protein LOC111022232 [Momordica charantia]|uniref:Uncharacterized protein LOC111022232 n=1 Tax=Momordica charantia TaxID=3673 RepID=A0A6J1DLG9_MOMCH|nr:uncharacterized protein LOC111022232 [Momordica charantia]